jgi:hypothetical protein
MNNDRQLNAKEAAAFLSQRTPQLPWSAEVVLRKARRTLPVFFFYKGELVVQSIDGQPETGTPPRTLDFDGIVRSLMEPDDEGIHGFAVPVEVVEVFSKHFTHKDGKLVRGIPLPTEEPSGGRITEGHSIVCWVEDANITPDKFLFHIDDLAGLASADETPQANSTPTAPVQRFQAQEQAILDAIRDAGHDPKKLPKPPKGKNGIKAQIRAVVPRSIFTSDVVFDKAWLLLRRNEDIADADPTPPNW